MKSAASDLPTDGDQPRSLVAGLSASFPSFASDIKIAHSVFALPFAATALLLVPLQSLNWSQIVALLVCMIGARSFAMGMNRYIDRDIDARNPRTQQRSIPSGQLRAQFGLVWSTIFAAVFVAAAFSLNVLSGWLSLPVLGILTGYSFMKRISWLTHWYLGFCLGMAPVAVSVALTGSIFPQVVTLGIAVMFWTAGFDILYSLQDIDFDAKHKYHSIPALVGVPKAIAISKASFALMILALIATGLLYGHGGWLFYFAIAAVATILFYEHWLIREVKKTGSLSRINAAFFTANAWVSVLFYALVQLDYLF